MNGFTVCQAVQNDPSLRHIAILVTSAKSYPADVGRAHELGANYYLMKPCDVRVLLQTVKTLAGDCSQVVVTFRGTRGSLPTPGAATPRYGGNTACVELRDGDTMNCDTGRWQRGGDEQEKVRAS